MFSTELYIGLRKYENFQSEAKMEQIIAIVTTCSVLVTISLKTKFVCFLVTVIPDLNCRKYFDPKSKYHS